MRYRDFEIRCRYVAVFIHCDGIEKEIQCMCGWMCACKYGMLILMLTQTHNLTNNITESLGNQSKNGAKLKPMIVIYHLQSK